ncbi:nucleotide sugar dehydrogenase [Gammaproteobacteria bacterium]|nr:nucleotide sugar dehydrogenase [Gammaproteobacteria bacterium]MDB9815992.1 nucleotide sugar dehydrogenase [Gammaproteobacteria bacterium]
MKISVVGMGYVGCANAILLAQNNSVSIIDIDQQKVEDFNSGLLPIQDSMAAEYLAEKDLHIIATSSIEIGVKDADFIILALPTDFDESTNLYNTDVIESVINEIIVLNNTATIIIKSTINIGFTRYVREKFNYKKIIFSPEFLREGHALEDNLSPSRIIVGDQSNEAKSFSALLAQGAKKQNIEILLTTPESAECIKLFSNSFLAMRVAFFNELDSYCLENNIAAKSVIEGVSLDPRIGNYYNNPSFGYGGYCLPKDSKQLLSAFQDVPQKLIDAIVESNKARKGYLLAKILEKKPSKVGIYKLAMKEGSDNSREAAVIDIMEGLFTSGVQVLIYDLAVNKKSFPLYSYCTDLQSFLSEADVIVANRLNKDLLGFKDKVFTRDIFQSDE